MKIHFTFFNLSLSLLSFTFWKMDGLFGQSIDEETDVLNQINIRKLTNSSEVVREFLRPGQKDNKICSHYIYLYNYQTGYSIGYITDKKTKYVKDFLIGKKNKNFLPYLINTKFYFCKEKPGIVQTDITKPTEGIRLWSFLCGHSRDKVSTIQNNLILLKEEFKVKSGVKIINQDDKVKIRKGDETLDFQKALIDYYVYDYNNFTDLVKNFSYSQKAKIIEKFRMSPSVGKHELKRLENSTILSVYAVIKDDKGENSIIWGLAQDNTTENREKFHWITHLGYDISFLFNKDTKKKYSIALNKE